MVTADVLAGLGLYIVRQLATQLGACLAVGLYTAVVSWALLKGIGATLGLRVDPESETRGLDLSQHDEAGYNS